jgi:hypothetical protein
MSTMDRCESSTLRRPQLVGAMLLAALGLALSGVGMLLLSRQAADYVDTARWPEYSLVDLIKSPTVRFSLPNSMVSWIYSPESLKDLHGALIGCLDAVSASWSFLIVGGFILWKALR